MRRITIVCALAVLVLSTVTSRAWSALRFLVAQSGEACKRCRLFTGHDELLTRPRPFPPDRFGSTMCWNATSEVAASPSIAVE